MDENEGQRRKRFHGLRAARRAQQPVVDERKPNVEKQLVELKAKAEIETHLLRSFFLFFFFILFCSASPSAFAFAFQPSDSPLSVRLNVYLSPGNDATRLIE